MSAIVKIQALRSDLVRRFPERSHVIDGCLAAIVASEHILLLGPPGTAKSALARAIVQAFGGTYFERLLTKFSTPDEVHGPISLKGLEQDRFERVTDGKLPEVEFAFIDEVYKANSAILNSMLTLMNERIFHNGEAPMQCPLVTLFGASNELHEGKELEALSDRFLVKFDVSYVTQLSSMRTILTAPEDVPAAVMTMDELRELQAASANVTISESTLEGLIAIRDACQGEGIIASDRRWKKSLKLVQATACMMGEAATTPEDLSVLVDGLWREPKEREQISRIVNAHADPSYAKAMEVLDSARELSKKIVSLKGKDKAAYVGQAVNAIDTFNEQKDELQKLTGDAGKRAKRTINDAVIEIQGMAAEARRVAASSLGLGGRMLMAAKESVGL